MNQKYLKLENLFKSSDLALVTAISLFYPIEVIDRTLSNKSVFYFKRDENLDKLVQAYWKNEIQVSPLAYFQQLKIIKSRLYDQGQNINNI